MPALIHLLKDSACQVNNLRHSGLNAEQAIKKGLGEKYKQLNDTAVFVNEARWIQYLFSQNIDFCDN